MSARTLSYSEENCEALDPCLSKDCRVFIMGEGVPDPKGVFGTTAELESKYGPGRIVDM